MAVAVALLAVLVVVLAIALAAQHRQSGRRATADEAEIEGLRGELGAASERAAAAAIRADAAEHQAVVAEARAVGAEAAHAAASADAAAAEEKRESIDASLWELELARSERTWRHSVSVAPGAPSPFADARDPLRLAVEIEAAALHEDAGAILTVDWDVDVEVESPARRLLVLRTAQELLAVAAREPGEVTLHATTDGGDDEVLLTLTTDESESASA